MGEATQTPHCAPEEFQPQIFGRYVLYPPIARGGMATVHLARLFGAEGFSRIVAAKRLFRRFAKDPEFVKMFRHEAAVASRIRHPNVVPVLDMVLAGEEVVLVQEYVHGVPLDRLFRCACTNEKPIPIRVVVAVVAGALAGLHAAHEVRSDDGEPLNIVHRDVSPQNIIIGVDGAPRLLDFGVAQAATAEQAPNASILAGKLAYMAPEQLRGELVTRQSDVYSCGVLLWELLTLRRLHVKRAIREGLAAGPHATPKITDVLADRRSLLSQDEWRYLARLDPIALRAVAPQPGDRYATAASFLQALLRACPEANPMETASWVKTTGAEFLEQRHQVLAANEASWRSLSDLAVSVAGASGPVSGVVSVRPEVPGVSTLSGTLVSSPGAKLPVGENIPSKDERWRRFVPWSVAGGALFVTGALCGLVASRQGGRPAIDAAHSVEAPLPSPPAAATPWTPPLPAVTAAPSDSIAEKTVESLPEYTLPPVHKAVPPARGTPAQLPASGTPMLLPAASSERTVCDPPFFFEGRKKIFKASCL